MKNKTESPLADPVALSSKIETNAHMNYEKQDGEPFGRSRLKGGDKCRRGTACLKQAYMAVRTQAQGKDAFSEFQC